jgi:hypothetical protein
MRRDRPQTPRWYKPVQECPREVRSGDILPFLTIILTYLEFIMSTLTDLQDQVAATLGAEQSAITLIQGLAAKIDALVAGAGTGGVDPAALVALSANLKASQDALAAAVVAGARPDPAPAPAPDVPTV